MRVPSITPQALRKATPIYVMGAGARFASNDEPEFSEAELLAADRQRNADKDSGAIVRQQADAAHADEVHRLRCAGAI